MLRLVPKVHTSTVMWAFHNKRAQSHLKAVLALIVKT
jgi:hypothetical protein